MPRVKAEANERIDVCRVDSGTGMNPGEGTSSYIHLVIICHVSREM